MNDNKVTYLSSLCLYKFKYYFINIFLYKRMSHTFLTQYNEEGASVFIGSVVKYLPANAGDMGSVTGLGGSHMLQSN